MADDLHARIAQLEAENAALRAEKAELVAENTVLTTERSEAREHQAATADILRASATSPIDVQQVLDAVAEHSARLCGAENASVYRREADAVRKVATYGPLPGNVPVGGTTQLGHRGLNGRVIRQRRTIHIEDIWAASDDEYPGLSGERRRGGYRSLVVVPVIRENEALGTIYVFQARPGPYTRRQIRLLETFADQAVIAIENARLFQELEQRNTDLREALERQTPRRRCCASSRHLRRS
jgi:two-component system NtrC family sensor kinase